MFLEKLKNFQTKILFATTPSYLSEKGNDWDLNFNKPRLDLPNNKISTGIYNAFNFVPKSLIFQFSRLVNVYFLVIALLQMVKPISATEGKPVGFIPLSIIIICSSIKELIEDLKRHRSDKAENNKVTRVHKDGKFEETRWGDLRVGQIIKIHDNEVVPADILLLNTSLKNGLCFIETMNLDGETALKSKFVHKELIPHMNSEEKIINSENQFIYEKPNEYLYRFIGCVHMPEGKIAMNDQNFVLRGCTLKNTGYIYGVVSYTGHSTKIMLNSTNSKTKTSKLEKAMGRQILNIFYILLLFCSFAAFYSAIWLKLSLEDHIYLDPYLSMEQENEFAHILFVHLGSWLLLLSRFVPISLIVNVEVVRLAQSFLITRDSEMISQKPRIQASVQSPNLTDELGQVQYILSDKTGTLTKNMMNFKKISIAGELYGEKISLKDFENFSNFPHVDFYDSNLIQDLMNPDRPNHSQVKESIFLLALCHTAKIQEKDDKKVFITDSPDELALVNFAKFVGVEFEGVDEEDNINIKFKGEVIQYKLLHVLEFNCDRKRMSVIVRTPDDKIMLYMKGADIALMERMSQYDSNNNNYIISSHHHLHQFATQGLRTLVLAKKEINPIFYKEWKILYESIQSKIEGRDEAFELIQSQVENNLQILGVTAVEDKLQDEVPFTIAQFRDIGIKFWMLTGDKAETAINIGYACGMYDDSMTHLQLVEKTNEEVTATMEKMLAQTKPTRDSKTKFSLVISGEALIHAMKPELFKKLMILVKRCDVLIACRVSPKQKQQFVTLLRADDPKVSILAIGDGANDVNMITAASVGVGICGLEGQQAARASDFAIGEFKLLRRLLFYHGRENYRRNSYLIIYNFYKNILFGSSFFWFGFFSGFSGTTFFDKFLTEFFNLLFTSVPIFLYAIFDHEFSPENLVSTPRLYIQGMKSKIFNNRKFMQWFFWGLMGSALITICGFNYYENKNTAVTDGKHSGLYGAGMLIFSGVVWLANIKIFAIAHTFNPLIVFCGFGGCLVYIGCFIITAHMTFTDVYSFATPMLLSWNFYAMLFILTVPSFLATFGYRNYKQLINPIKITKSGIQTLNTENILTYKPLFENLTTREEECPTTKFSTPIQTPDVPLKFTFINLETRDS